MTLTCKHHWVIEMANGHLSRGVCRHCSEVRMFTNSEAEWGPEKRSVAAHTRCITAATQE